LFERRALKVFDKVVLVSDACKDSFDRAFPEYKDKSVVVENMLSSELLKKRSQEFLEDINIDETYVNFVSVCRIDNDSKALDRALNVVEKLIVEGYKIKWYIVGDGKDKTFMENAILEKSLENNVFLVGSRVNPFPLLCKMDLFFLPSRFEGKPMSVTEAQILGVPPVVTNYSTANSQVNHSFDGYILENNDEGIYNGLKEILDNPNWIIGWKKNLSNQSYDNIEEMEKIYSIIED
jgi:glycosyltransferase involved in cell wall biosynthesis